MFTQSKKIVFAFLILFFGIGLIPFSQSANGQILNPNDPIVIYNPASPPVQPAQGVIGKWVITPVNGNQWDQPAFKAYIYNGMAFRLMYPKSYQPGVNDGKTYPVIIDFRCYCNLDSIYGNDSQIDGVVWNLFNANNTGTTDAFILVPLAPSARFGPTYYQFLQDICAYMAVNTKADPQRVIALGYSGGAYSTWEVLNEFPKFLAAGIAFSAASFSFNQGIPGYKFTPIWDFQGGFDTNPLPSTTQSLINNINAAGGNITYTFYPNDGHYTYGDGFNEPNFWNFINGANKANPWPLHGRTGYCSGTTISDTLGITPGFDGYQWKRNDTLISGATANTYIATKTGTYSARYLNGTTWSSWSPTPVVIYIKGPTITPAIQLAKTESNVYPSPDTSGGGVALTVPGSFIHYAWVKAGTTTVLDTNQVFIAKAPGQYQVTVAEKFGCSGNYSPIYTVVSASGTGAPAPATNLSGYSPSLTSIKITWVKNTGQTYNNTGFEVYRANQASGPYTFLALTPSDTTNYLDNTVSQNKTYYYIVRAVNGNGAAAATAPLSVITQVDIIPPTAPGNLNIVSGTTFTNLSWSASTDNVNVAGYYVYVNGVKSYTTNNLNYTIYGLIKGQNYYFTVAAFDPSGNISAQSNQVSALIQDNGLNYIYYESPVGLNLVPNFNTITPTGYGNVPNFTLSPAKVPNNYALLFTGTMHIPVTGNYTIQNSADDGSNVYIDMPYSPTATPTIANDGAHATQTISKTLYLTKGDHPIAVSYFQQGGGVYLGMTWSNTPTGVGNTPVPIPDSIFAAKNLNANTVSSVKDSVLTPTSGFTYNYYETPTSLSVLPNFNTLTPTATGTVSNVNLTPAKRSTNFALMFKGTMNIKVAGNYTIQVGSDDGANVYIDQPYSPTAVPNINDDGLHGVVYQQTTMYLSKGNHSITVTYFQAGGGLGLSLNWLNTPTGVGSTAVPIPDSVFVGQTLVAANSPSPLIQNNGVNYIYYESPSPLSQVPNFSTITPTSQGTLTNISLSPAKVANNYAFLFYGTLHIPKSGQYTFQTGSDDGSNFYIDQPYSPTAIPDIANDGVHAYATQQKTYYLTKGNHPIALSYFQATGGATLNLNWSNTPTGVGATPVPVPDSIFSIQNAPGIPPQAPSNLIADGASYNKVQLKWRDSLASNPTGVQIYRSNALNGNYSIIANARGIDSVYVDSISLSPSTSYFYKIQAINNFGASNITGVSVGTTSGSPKLPTTPFNLSGSALSTSKIKINWQDSIYTVNSYQLYRSTIDTLHFQPVNQKTISNSSGNIGNKVNLALNKPAYASSSYPYLTYNGPLDASLAVDGNFSTRWSSNFSDNQWFYVDLGKVYPLSDVKIYWENARGMNYQIQLSNDAINWTTVSTISGNSALSNDIPISGSGRYVRMLGTSRYTTAGYSIYEFQVYGTTVAQNPNLASISYTDSTLVGSTNYYYKVVAQNAKGNSGFSSTLKVPTQAYPPPPFKAIAPQTMRFASVLTLSLFAYDPTGAAVTFSSVKIPSFATLQDFGDGTGTLNLNPNMVQDTGKFTMILKATSIYGSTFDTIKLTVNQAYPPSIIPITAFQISGGDSTLKVLSATDINAGAKLSWTFSAIPSFVKYTINANGTVSFNIKPKPSDSGIYTLNATVADGVGGVSTTTIGITVNNATDYTYLNFGDNAHIAPSPWNTTGWNIGAGKVFNLLDQKGLPSGKLTLLQGWSGTNNSGAITGNNSGIYPDIVTQSCFSYTGSDTISVQLGGLNQNLLYDLSFFSSWANPWSGAVTTYAVGNTQVNLDGKNNTSKTVSINGLIPDANGNITIKMAKSAISSNALLGALVFKSHSNPNLNKTAPTAPISLAVKDSLPAEKLTWVNTSTNATGIQVYRTPSNGDTTKYSLLTTSALSGTATSYLDASAQGNATYYYKINALNSFGNSPYSNIVKVNTANKPPQINSIANQTYNINTKDSLTIGATPLSGTSLSLSLSGLFGSSTFKDLGNGTGLLAMSPLVSDTGKHTLILSAKDSFGGTTTQSFTITISGTTYTSTYINFGDNAHAAPSPWNNTGYNVNSGTNFSLLDQTGKASGTMTLLSNFGAPASGMSTGNNSGVYPDAVISSSFSYGNADTAKIQFSGLNTANLYNFTFFSSWAHPWSGAITDFAIGSTLVSLDGTNNSNNTVSIKGVAPNAAGIITVKIAKDINASSAYINALVFQTYTNPNQVKSAPTAPNTLVAKDSLPGVKLSWINTANNAANYAVYRAPVTGGVVGTFVQINPGSTNPNQNTYLDTSARGMASYAYKVAASNSLGLSPYSNTVSLTTTDKPPVIATIANASYNINTQDTLHVSASLRSGTSITLSLSGLFGTAKFTDQGNGAGYLSLSPILADSGSHTLTLTAKDAFGGITTQSFNVYISGTVYTSTYINFGDNAHMAPSPWNNTGFNVNSGTIFNLNDQNGKASGTMTLLSNFGAPASGALTGNNSGVYPDAVISSSFSYSNSDTAKIQISGLNTNNLYNFTFFTSWAHPWSGAITDFAIGSTLVSLDGTNNTNNTVSIKGVAPNASGIITLKIAKDINASSAYINAIVFQSYSNGIVIPPSPPSPPTLLTAHGSSTTAIKLNWVAAASASSYYIYRASASTGPYTLIDSVNAAYTTYTNTGLTINTGYFYQIKSKNKLGLSVAGNIAYGTTLQYMVDVQFDSDQPAGAPWNSFNSLPSTGLSIPNLTNTSGSNTGITVTLTHNFDGANIQGAVTGNNSGIYPDKVIRGQYYVQNPDSAIITFSGLSLSTSYDLVFFNSWGNPFDTGNTSFTVNGKSVTLNSANNISNTSQLNNIQANASGIINLVVKSAPGSTYGILSALVLQAHQIPPNIPNVSVGGINKEQLAYFDPNKSNTVQATAYPVPFGNNLNISLNAPESGQFKVSLFDLTGRIVYDEAMETLNKGQNLKTLDSNLPNLPSGLYIIRIESDVFPTKTILVRKN